LFVETKQFCLLNNIVGGRGGFDNEAAQKNKGFLSESKGKSVTFDD